MHVVQGTLVLELKETTLQETSSEIFGIFKKPLVEIFEIRNKFSMSKKLRNPPLVETKTKKPAGFFNFVDFGANTQIQCVSEHVQFKIHL